MQHDLREKQPIHSFVETAYLDYAMYVILDRALPNIGDGLKPVQRRIIYAMSELHLNYLAKYKKCARTIGDVLGKFHPHGETACYDAMVLMAQPFASRYPLIEGQGNFGTADDPKSFAAMRYTEAKLSKYAQVLLEEIDDGAVVWVNNFDGTLKEPKVLPAKLPMVLLNGTTGIAVGMATDLIPHNLYEVAEACMYILEHKNPESITVDQLCKYILGPDFPTKAEIITPRNELLEIYKNGYGTVKARAVYFKEKDNIVITALPYMVSGAKVLKQVADQIQNKNLPFIVDLRDDADQENPTRLIFTLRSNRVDVDAVMSHLFATTELEKNYRVNFNMIGTDGKPQVKSLLQILTEWLEFRLALVKTKLEFSLDKIINRLHILEGFLIVYLKLDTVIKIIRFEDEPKIVLMKKFKLTEVQVNAVLDLKLKHLAKLEEIKIKEEANNLIIEKERITAILASKDKLKSLVKKEIKEIANRLKDPRISELKTRSPARILDNNLLNKSVDSQITVILSDKGWVRCGKGHDIDPNSLNYRSGEQYKSHDIGSSNQKIIFFDSKGRSYSLSATSLPSMRGYGEPLTSKLLPESGATFEAVIIGDVQQKVLLVQSRGFGFVTNIDNLQAKTKNGKNIINLNEATLLPPLKLNSTIKYCVFLTSDCKMLVFDMALIPELNKGRGSKLCATNKKNSLIAVAILGDKSDLKINYGKKQIIVSFKELLNYLGEIGAPGKPLSKLPKDSIKKYIIKLF